MFPLKLKYILSILASVICMGVHGQSNTFNQTLYWLRYQNQLIFSPKLWWNNEVDNRRFIGPDVQNQLIIHSRLHYKIKKWDLATGLTYSLAYAAIPEQGYTRAVAELRPVIEASYEVPVRNSLLQMRVRIDNRFFENDPGQNVLEESEHVLRHRYRVQFRFPLLNNESDEVVLSVRVADEIMFNAEKNFFDQNRIYVTSEYYLSPSWSLETGYLYIYQQRFGREDYFSRNVLRFSVLHRIRI